MRSGKRLLSLLLSISMMAQPLQLTAIAEELPAITFTNGEVSIEQEKELPEKPTVEDFSGTESEEEKLSSEEEDPTEELPGTELEQEESGTLEEETVAPSEETTAEDSVVPPSVPIVEAVSVPELNTNNEAVSAAENVAASGTCGENLTWKLDNAGLLTISGEGEMEDYSSTVQAPWYEYKSQVQTVVVEDGVTNIGSYAFYGCNSLTTVELPENMISIGNHAFSECTSLAHLEIPIYVNRIDYAAFNGCSSLESMALPGGITTISGDIFIKCTSLCSVTIPASVISIEAGAFYECNALTEILYQGTAEQMLMIEIGSLNPPLLSCPWTTEGMIIGRCGENLCWSLDDTGVLTISGIGEMEDYLDYNSSTTGKAPWNLYAADIREIHLSEGLTAIGSYAFYNCSELTEVYFPESLTVIGASSFRNCSSLTEVTVPEGITKLSGVFRGCSNLERITLPSTLKFIGNITFGDCSSLESIEIPEGVEEMENWVFEHCDSLHTISLPSTLRTMGSRIFDGCDNLKEINIPEGVTTLDRTFDGCSNLEKITLPGSMGTIPAHTFNGHMSLKYVELGHGITRVEDDAFYYGKYPEYLVLPSSVTYISESSMRTVGSTAAPITIYYEGSSSRWNSLQTTYFSDSFLQCLTVICGDYIPLTGFSIWEDNITMTLGDAVELTRQISPSNASCTDLVWTSSDESVATVENGVVTAVGNGTTMITAVTGEGSFSDSCTVDVKYKVSGSTADNLSWTLDANGLMTISGTGTMQDYALNAPAPWNAYGSDIKAIKISDGVRRIGSYAFCYTDAETVEISDSVTSVGDAAFMDCEMLTSVKLPSSITVLPGWIFAGCKALADLDIPESVTEIQAGAFNNCSSLAEIQLPERLTTLGDELFSGCASLVSVTIPSPVKSVGFGMFSGCSDLVSANLPESLSSIGANAFSACSSLMTIELPENLSSIGASAFMNCTALEQISIPGGVEEILDETFRGCSSLKQLTLNSGLQSLGSRAFYQCSLEHIVFPETLSSIGAYAFGSCQALNSVEFHSAATVGQGAFENAVSLTSLKLYSGMNLEWWAFQDCTALKTLELPSSLTIGRGAFAGTVIEHIVIPEGETKIDPGAFAGCTSLKKIDIPDSVTSIGSSAFEGCSSLVDFELPKNVTEITAYMLAGTGIRSFEIPARVVSVGAGAFSNCASITSFEIPSHIKVIEPYLLSGTGITSFVVPDWVESVGEAAFSQCRSLKKVELPDHLTTIPNQLFFGCEVLESIEIPAGVTEIGECAFSGCKTLTAIYLPVGLTKLGAMAFDGASALESMYIPDGVHKISTLTFSSCPNLETIYLPTDLEQVEDYAFLDCNSLATVYFRGSEEQWKSVVIGMEGNDALRNATIIFNSNVPALNFSIQPSTVELCPDEQIMLETSIYPENTNVNILWTSDDPGVAIVDNGMVLTTGNGRATITAEIENQNILASCEVVVTTPAEGVTLDRDEAYLAMDSTLELTATVTPDTASNQSLIWTSSDGKIATVQDGVVTSVSRGVVTITVTTEDGGFEASCQISVGILGSGSCGTNLTWILYDDGLLEISGSGTSIDYSSASSVPWYQYRSQIKKIQLPASLSVIGQNVFHSCNALTSVDIPESVSKIAYAAFRSCTALQTIKIPESVTLIESYVFYSCNKLQTVYYGGSEKSWKDISINSNNNPLLNANIIFAKPTSVENIYIATTDHYMFSGDSFQLETHIEPTYATNQNVTWSSSNEKVATVENGFVKAIGNGQTEITVTTEDGEISASCIIYVTTKVSGVELDKEYAVAEMGKTLTLKATVSPETASDQSLQWYSEDEDVAIVENGVVTPASNGETTIRVLTNDGNFEASCIVTVITKVNNITLDFKQADLFCGTSLQLNPTIEPETASNRTVSWYSDNEKVATVQNGLVTAVGNGTANIIVTTEDGAFTASCQITVLTKVDGVFLDHSEATILMGETLTLTATVSPEAASNQSVTWTSDNTNVVTVQDGVVTPISNGTATITVTTEDGSFHANCLITVATSVTGVSLMPPTLTLDKGESRKLTAVLEPETASDRGITWFSDNEEVAVVKDGIVTAVDSGTAYIQVTTNDGNFTAICEVTVPVRADYVRLDKENAEIYIGETMKLIATVYPEDAVDREVTWSTNNPNIATVENGVVTPVSNGTAMITVTTVDGGHSASCEVTVKTYVAQVALDREMLDLEAGESETLFATVLPEEASNKTVLWSSDNESVAVVENGTVVAKSNGTAIITATTEDGNYSASCTVTVTTPVKGVELDLSEAVVAIGETLTLKAIVSPETASNPMVQWTSGNSAVATVENGVVTPLANGKVIIMATTEDSGYAAICEVTVITRAESLTLDRTEATVFSTEPLQLKATVLPETASDKTITWSSSDDTIATVDSSGFVKAVGNGKATITARTADGRLEASCVVEAWRTLSTGALGDNLSYVLYEDGRLVISGEGAMPDYAHYGYTPWSRYRDSIKEAEIQDGVTNVGKNIFDECINLERIAIPDSVTAIGDHAFDNCSSLKEITLSGQLTTIGQYAFHGCSSLAEISIPYGITKIEEWTFYGCSSLKKVSIPVNVKEIGRAAFFSTGVEQVTFSGNAEQWSNITLGSNNDSLTDAEITFLEETPVRAVELDQTLVAVQVGNTLTLKATTIPSMATNQNILWSSSDPTVATVENGLVTALSAGRVTITATAEGTDISASCEVEVTSWQYSVSNGTVTLTGHSDDLSGEVVIPETIGGKAVTGLGGYLFQDMTEITAVKIPESVTSFGYGIFWGCTALESVNIPNGVTVLNSSTFKGCSNLKSIELPKNLTSIGSSAFSGCAALETINIPNGITKIENSTFSGCSSLKSIELPENLISIGSSAFNRCSALEMVNIPSGIEKIENGTFHSCSGLKFIELPSDIISIGTWAFYGCDELKSIELPSGLTSLGTYAFSNCSALEAIKIPNGVTKIEDHTFSSCSSLKSVELPSGLTSIGIGVFYQCSALENIDIPDAVTSVGMYAFENCTSLTGIDIPNSVIKIEDSLFDGCSNLKSVELPTNLISIGIHAFNGCSSLESLNLPSGVTSIGNYAFWNCTSLESINIPSGLTIIEDSTFNGCSSLKSIELPAGLTSIGAWAFSNCTALRSISIPDAVTQIGERAFSGCATMNSITLPASLTSIGNSTFRYNDSLANVYYKGTAEQWNSITIGEYNDPLLAAKRFYGSLTTITIGDHANGQLLVSEDAAVGAVVTIIAVPDSGYRLKTIYVDGKAIQGNQFTVSGNHTVSADFSYYGAEIARGADDRGVEWYVYENGHLYVTSTTGQNLFFNTSPWIRYAEQIKTVEIDNAVTNIDLGFFLNMSNLEKVTFKGTLEEWVDAKSYKGIDEELRGVLISCRDHSFTDYAYLYENNVTYGGITIIDTYGFFEGDITIPASIDEKTVRAVAPGAFYKNNALTSIVVPDCIESLSGFANCENLSKVTMYPKALNIIDDRAFQNCVSLKTIELPATVNIIGERAFRNCTSLTEVVLPKSVRIVADEAFSGCTSLKEIDLSTVNSIGETAFAGCTSLKNVTLSNDLEAIEAQTFMTCSSLQEITLLESLTSIGSEAFKGCSKLYSVEIPSRVTSIGTWAFEDCGSLVAAELPAALTTISQGAFDSSCEKLADIYYKGSASSWNDLLLSNSIADPADEYNYNGALMTAQIHYSSDMPVLTPPQGVTVSGIFDVYGIDVATAKVELLAMARTSIVVAETTLNADGSFLIENVPEGSYTLRLSAEGLISREEPVQVGSEDTNVSEQLPEFYITKKGDINGDGKVTLNDVDLLFRTFTSYAERGSYECQIANIQNNNDTIDMNDVDLLFRTFNTL